MKYLGYFFVVLGNKLISPKEIMDTTVQEVKSRLNVVDFVGEYVRLVRAGSSYKGLCPFHSEKTPSFVVSEERQSWHCFGCQKGGDIFTFLMEAEGVEFREALKILADRAGIELPRYNPQVEKKKRSSYEVLESATKWYESQLNSERGAIAKRYLLERGISEESIRIFRLGYAPDGWNHISDHLRSLGYTENDIEPTGLLVQKSVDQQHTINNEEAGMRYGSSVMNRSYDRFRNRILFPIGDILGRVIGYSARVMPGADEKQGKYINTPETTIYHKSQVLYGIAQAKQAIKREDKVIVVEGNMDVIAMYQSGFQNTVAVSGTAMTEEHIGTLRRYTKNIILFFDMDRAGREATYKSTIACFRGEMNVFLMNVAGGKDAAELAQTHPEELRNAVRSAENAMDFFCESILGEADLSKSEEKKEAVEKLLPLLDALVNEVEQSDWERRIAERVEVETTAVTAALHRYADQQARPSRLGERSGESALISEKKRSDILLEMIAGKMFISGMVWKRTIRYVANKMDGKVQDFFKRMPILERAFALGEEAGYDFDQFRALVDEGDIVLNAQEMVSRLGELDDGKSEVERWDEMKKLFKELEREVWKQVLESLVKDIRKSDQAGDTATRDSLTRQFGEISQKLQSI